MYLLSLTFIFIQYGVIVSKQPTAKAYLKCDNTCDAKLKNTYFCLLCLTEFVVVISLGTFRQCSLFVSSLP